VSVDALLVDRATSGTEIRLDRLRRRWTDRSLGAFLAELEAFRPPRLLVEPLPESIARGPVLFSERPSWSISPGRRGTRPIDPGFEIVSEGDFGRAMTTGSGSLRGLTGSSNDGPPTPVSRSSSRRPQGANEG